MNLTVKEVGQIMNPLRAIAGDGIALLLVLVCLLPVPFANSAPVEADTPVAAAVDAISNVE